MNKEVFSHWLSWLFPLSIATGLGLTLFLDGKATSIPNSVNICIIVLSALLSYVAIEWAYFIIKFNDKMKSTNKIALLLAEFAEANMMLDNLMQSVRCDLDFDKKIKSDKEHLDFHLFLSKIKYQKYLSSHFVFKSDEKIIQKIPKYYFEDSIWKKLVSDSECYSSLQLLDSQHTGFYLDDTDRRDLEINFIISKLSQRKEGSKLRSFKKLFILDDKFVDVKNKKINNVNLQNYLQNWLDRFDVLKSSDGNAQLKIIKISEAQGAISAKHLQDIGIFDNILGIQKVYSNIESDFNDNALRFDFSLDVSAVRGCKNDYDSIFSRAINLNDFFVTN